MKRNPALMDEIITLLKKEATSWVEVSTILEACPDLTSEEVRHNIDLMGDDKLIKTREGSVPHRVRLVRLTNKGHDEYIGTLGLKVGQTRTEYRLYADDPLVLKSWFTDIEDSNHFMATQRPHLTYTRTKATTAVDENGEWQVIKESPV